jgi:lysophospholipase L1-like esterase
MKRLLKAAAALFCAFGLPFAHAQLTTITAASISMGGTPIAAGTVTYTPVNASGIPIAFATGGGGLNSPTAFSGTIASGAIAAGFQVPDACLTTPANILYSVQITNTATQKSFTLQSVPNVCGTTWALDHYGPPSPTSNIQPVQSAYGTAAPPASCITPSFYTRNISGGQFFTCVAGVFVRVQGDGATLPATSSLLKGDGAGGAVAAAAGTDYATPSAVATAQSAAIASAVASGVQKSANLSDLANAATARANLGISSTQALLNQLPANGLIALYTHADCSQPYKDYSGNGNDGTTISGVVAPLCDVKGLSYYTAVALNAWQLPAAATNQALTYVFSVIPYLGTTSNGAVNQSIMQSSSSTGGVLTLIGTGSPGNASDAWQPGMGTTTNFRITDSTSFVPSASTIAYSIGTGVASDKDQIFINGTEVPYTSLGSTTTSAFNVGTMQVGGNSFPFYGTESVTLLYNRKLTVAEQIQISNALNDFTQTRSGLVFPAAMDVSLPSRIVCDGNSITFGQGVPNSWCTSALFSLPGETFTITHQNAVPGKLMAAMQSRIAQEVIPLYSVNAPRNTGYVYAGTNDIARGDTAANVWNYGINAIKNTRWKNSKIIWMPMTSRLNQDTGKDAYNTLSNAQCSLYADYCVASDDPLLYADGAYANVTYFQGDGIHPTTAGQTLLATYASNAYQQIYGSTMAAPTQVSTSTYTVTASDNYITATANSAITLYNCLGYSKFVHIKVLPGLTVTVANATSAQTIDGVDHSSSALALTAGSNYTFQVVIGPTSTGGCTWVIN